MPLVAILVSALAGLVVSGLWLRRFGSAWRAAAQPAEAAGAGVSEGARLWIAAALVNVIVAGAMRHILVSGAYSGPIATLITGLEMGIGVAAPWAALSTLAAGRPLRLAAIEAGLIAAACTVIGLVLGFFV